jgi:hypothetical protein
MPMLAPPCSKMDLLLCFPGLVDTLQTANLPSSLGYSTGNVAFRGRTYTCAYANNHFAGHAPTTVAQFWSFRRPSISSEPPTS